MNLLIDAHSLDDHYQGSRTYLSGLYRSLIANAPFIHFFFAANNTVLLEKQFGSHENVSYLKFRTKSNLYRLLIDIPRMVKAHKIDAAHFQYAVPFLKTCQEIVTIHDVLFIDFPHFFPFVYRQIRTPIFRRSGRRANLLLTVSSYSQKTISDNFDIPLKNIHVIPNGIDHSFYSPKKNISPQQPDKSSAPYLLYVSRVEPRKNHVLLLQVYKELELAKKGYRMIFIGKKDIESRAFDSYWNRLSGKEKSCIDIIESVSQDQLLTYYRNATLFIYPSLAEGFGIPPIEAAALGIPALCSNATAMSDFYFFGDRLFDPLNKEELKLKIEKILGENDIKETDSIRNKVLTMYNWDKIANDFLKLMEAHIIKKQPAC